MWLYHYIMIWWVYTYITYYVYVGCPCIKTNKHCLHRCTAHAWKNIFMRKYIYVAYNVQYIHSCRYIYIYTHIYEALNHRSCDLFSCEAGGLKNIPKAETILRSSQVSTLRRCDGASNFRYSKFFKSNKTLQNHGETGVIILPNPPCEMNIIVL